MHISKELPQFTTGAALIIASGSYEADFYVAENGALEEVATFTIEKTDPAIPEGFEVKDSGGKKHLLQVRHADFMKAFAEHVNAAVKSHPAKMAHLFAPAEVLKELAAALPAELQKNLTTHEGNFHKEHPFKLLEKIAAKT